MHEQTGVLSIFGAFVVMFVAADCQPGITKQPKQLVMEREKRVYFRQA